MKHILLIAALLAGVSTSYAQYDRDKLIGILSGGSAKTWTVKSVNTERPEKSFTFNKDMSATIEKVGGKGAGASEQTKWTLTTKDNIRWFVSIGNAQYELIVSYSKDGSQYMKLVHAAGNDKASGSFEMNLFPAK